jgi:hypothetical protein
VGECEFITNAIGLSDNSYNIGGACWGLYRKTTTGICGIISIEWWTAVIGDGFSYWYLIAVYAGGGTNPAGGITGSTDPGDWNIVSTFTPL